jgi:hypothetical protein
MLLIIFGAVTSKKYGANQHNEKILEIRAVLSVQSSAIRRQTAQNSLFVQNFVNNGCVFRVFSQKLKIKRCRTALTCVKQDF